MYDRALSADQIRAQVSAMMGDDQPDGSGRDRAAPTCRHILENHPELAGQDGAYWINPYSADPRDAVQTYCDMSTDGDGPLPPTRVKAVVGARTPSESTTESLSNE